MAEKTTRRRTPRKRPGLKLASESRGRGGFAPVADAVEAFRQGRMVIVVDDEDRENEGDLTVAAEKTTPEIINFMAKHGRGLICLPMTGEWLDRLDIPLMVEKNTSQFDTAFCVSVESKESTSTGISAADRATTARVAADPKSTTGDFTRPGHMFPLRARDGGVLVRAGQTEAAVDLAKIAELQPVGVICEIMNEDGTMARVPDLRRFARKHKLLMITIADLIKYRMSNERLVRRAADAKLPTDYGDFEIASFESVVNGETHLALVRGDIGDGEDVLVRVHSRCLTGEVFHSARCDCGAQLASAMQRISDEGRGVLLYLNQEGRGIGLTNKIRAYNLQDQGYDTVEANERLGFKADQRDYGIGAQILSELGVKSMRLLTNNPRKFVGLEGYGLSVSASLALEVPITEASRPYLRTKKKKLGHTLKSV